MSKAKSDYYAGGYRITIGGVPCRVNIKPTPHMLALWRDNESSKQLKLNASIRHAETLYLPLEA